MVGLPTAVLVTLAVNLRSPAVADWLMVGPWKPLLMLITRFVVLLALPVWMSAPPPKPEPNCRTPPAPAALLVPMSLIELTLTLPLSKPMSPVKLLFGFVRVNVRAFCPMTPSLAVLPSERTPVQVTLWLFTLSVQVPLASVVVTFPAMVMGVVLVKLPATAICGLAPLNLRAALMVNVLAAARVPLPLIAPFPPLFTVSVWLFTAPAPRVMFAGLEAPPVKSIVLTETPPAPRSMMPPTVPKVAVSAEPGAGEAVQLPALAQVLPSAAAPVQVPLAARAVPEPSAIKASAEKPKNVKNEVVDGSGMDFIRVSGSVGLVRWMD